MRHTSAYWLSSVLNRTVIPWGHQSVIFLHIQHFVWNLEHIQSRLCLGVCAGVEAFTLKMSSLSFTVPKDLYVQRLMLMGESFSVITYQALVRKGIWEKSLVSSYLYPRLFHEIHLFFKGIIDLFFIRHVWQASLKRQVWDFERNWLSGLMMPGPSDFPLPACS